MAVEQQQFSTVEHTHETARRHFLEDGDVRPDAVLTDCAIMGRFEWVDEQGRPHASYRYKPVGAVNVVEMKNLADTAAIHSEIQLNASR
jgi:hypothetical protein